MTKPRLNAYLFGFYRLVCCRFFASAHRKNLFHPKFKNNSFTVPESLLRSILGRCVLDSDTFLAGNSLYTESTHPHILFHHTQYMSWRNVEHIQLQLQNARFLETIRKTRTDWKQDKELSKIVKKMEKGKNLRKKEFAKIHWFLWNIGH